MGLAASQARFLAITARKMNCEFQSMQIAQEKLSVTRDLQKAAQDYQNSLSQTKLIWDTDDDQYDLSYNVMMTPSTLNEYDPYLITDTLGRVLLSDPMFDAAVDAGIIYENGTPKGKLDVAGNGTGIVYMGNYSVETDTEGNEVKLKNESKVDGSRNAFLYQLGQKNQIDGAMADKIIGLGDVGYTKSGIGGKIYDKSTSNAMKPSAFIKYMKETTWEEAGKKYDQALNIPEGVNKTDKIYNVKLGSIADIGDYQQTTVNMANGYAIVKDGQTLSKDAADELTVGDLLSGKYSFVIKNDQVPIDISEVYEKVLSPIASVLGYNAAVNFRGLNVDTESDMALDIAYEFTKVNSSTTSVNDTDISNLCNKATAQNNVISGGNGTAAFSLTNMVKSFLTNFALAIDGYDSEYNVDKTSVKKSKYVTDDPSYYFLLKNDAAITDTTMLNADFYNMLYNQIVTNGAISDKSLRDLYTNDTSMLQNALKNGNLFVSSLHNDGYFYQGPYTASGHVAEIPDEDAIARAELEYTITKAKLNTKEEGLEIQMKNLDMEISSLTTEFDTVKNLISKNVEKVFTMFST